MVSYKKAYLLSDVVYEHGYADQSHFIRDFKKYTHTKPSRFRKKN